MKLIEVAGETEGEWKILNDTEVDFVSKIEFGELKKEVYDGKVFNEVSSQEFKHENGTVFYLTETSESIKREFAHDEIGNNSGETARHFANRHATSVVTNASTAGIGSDGLLKPRGINIHNGEVIWEFPNNVDRWYLVVSKEGILTAKEPSSTKEELLALNPMETLIGFCPLIENGVSVSEELLEKYANVTKTQNPLQLIYQLKDHTIGWFTCNGRLAEQPGVTAIQAIDYLLKNKDIQFCYMLDGGGSVQTVVRNRMINLPCDNEGYDERFVCDFLYSDAPNFTFRDREIQQVAKDVGVVMKQATDNKAEARKYFTELAKSITTSELIGDCNAINQSGDYWANTSTKNIPNSGSHFAIKHFQNGTLKIQIAYSLKSNSLVYKRTKISAMDDWNEWIAISENVD